MAEIDEAPLCLPPRPLSNAAGLRLPAGTCDAHFHVFAADAPLASPRSYTPRIETIDGWLALASTFGIARGVLVQPSVYGLDNRILLAALAEHGSRLRGVVVVSENTDLAELRRLDVLGVRGIRFNLRNKAGIGLDALATLAPRMRKLGWHAQFQIGPDSISTVAELASHYDIPGVIDHLAFMPLDPPGEPVDALLRALEGEVHVKLSAPYRLRDTAHHDGFRQVAATLASHRPDRLLWGSDWPHTELFDAVPGDDDLIALSLDAIPAAAHDLVFRHNAERLYWSR
jgi:predicted TIM-barrel fold metal-dependent hydrolase